MEKDKQINRSGRIGGIHSDIRGPLYVEAQRMRAAGIDVLRLNTGNPAVFGFSMPESVRQALLQHADDAVGYCDPKGMPAARQAICSYHRAWGIRGITEEDIFVGNGVSEVVGMALGALLESGDEILMPTPCYSLWSNSVRLYGGTPVFYRCDEQSLWYPDLEDLRRKITPRTRGLVIINPNNPTGAVYPKELLLQMLELARQHNLVVFSDEIYDRLVLDDVPHTPTASLAEDLLVLTFNGLSKSHIICGFRCGWMVVSGPKQRAADYLDGLFQLAAMRLCGNALTQLVIPAAMADDASTRAMLVPGGRLFEQREACMRELSCIEGVSCVKNAAAFYVFPKLDTARFGITDDRRFAMDLLREKHILIVPGSGFEWEQPDHFRIVMLPQPQQLAKAVRDIGEFLQHYKQR